MSESSRKIQACILCGITKGYHEFSFCQPEMENRNIAYVPGALKERQKHFFGEMVVVKNWGKSIDELLDEENP